MKTFTEHFNLPDPVCMYKWTWSTIRLSLGTTNSCHRIEHDEITPETYHNFHNTPQKIADRKLMLEGKWPKSGCQYCEYLEKAGASSDRTELNKDIFLAPPELKNNPRETSVTPRMVEVYFNNLCNLNCIYCGGEYSTVWEVEEKKFNLREPEYFKRLEKNRKQYPAILEAHWKWLEKNAHEIYYYGVLGGEPFFQPELEQNIEFFEKNPCPELGFFIFSNLKVDNKKMRSLLDRVIKLIKNKHIKTFRIVCSFDCWGPQQEYIRTGINLKNWEENFTTLLHDYPTIDLQVHSTLISLTMQTLPDLCDKVTEWNKVRFVRHTLSFADGRPEMDIGIFPRKQFAPDFSKAIRNTCHPETKEWITGFYKKVAKQPEDPEKIKELKNILDQIDIRRGTNWRKLWPWLDEYEV